jgi:uncharacterized protein
MSEFLSKPCTAFEGNRLLSAGPLLEVALAVKAAGERGLSEALLTFDDANGAVIDLDLRGSKADVIARLSAAAASAPVHSDAGRSVLPDSLGDVAPNGLRRRGRPRLGVVAREVTLLPRHWEWLALQPGGASVVLRRLVDEARRSDRQTQILAMREAAYRFMSAIAGALPGFEEATRALLAGDRKRFERQTAAWPADLRNYAMKLAWGSGAEAAPAKKEAIEESPVSGRRERQAGP